MVLCRASHPAYPFPPSSSHPPFPTTTTTRYASVTEVHEALSGWGNVISQGKLALLIQQCSKNNDGRISCAEIRKALNKNSLSMVGGSIGAADAMLGSSQPTDIDSAASLTMLGDTTLGDTMLGDTEHERLTSAERQLTEFSARAQC